MKTGNTPRRDIAADEPRHASMEPGHEDREYSYSGAKWRRPFYWPQWSPVMKTGNTWARCSRSAPLSGLNGARS